MTPTPRRGWPPPPHDPRERIVLSQAGDWQVRAFTEDDPRFVYLAPRGMWHIQLWHPTSGVSILTPSGLTSGQFEIFPVGAWKRLALGYRHLRSLVQAFHGIGPPSEGVLQGLQELFVHGPVNAIGDVRVRVDGHVVGTEDPSSQGRRREGGGRSGRCGC